MNADPLSEWQHSSFFQPRYANFSLKIQTKVLAACKTKYCIGQYTRHSADQEPWNRFLALSTLWVSTGWPIYISLSKSNCAVGPRVRNRFFLGFIWRKCSHSSISFEKAGELLGHADFLISFSFSLGWKLVLFTLLLRIFIICASTNVFSRLKSHWGSLLTFSFRAGK